jgi:tRNA-Thr(GGU) m(6)t(6)A37 methyltransferase TsaA
MQTIAYLSSPFKQKFGLPRQAGMIKSTDAFILMQPPFNDPNAFRGITEFSHLWLQFLFHENIDDIDFRPMVRPPRLGGNEKVGVFACRSPFRPNGIGLSLVEFKELIVNRGNVSLRIACPDLLDGTPIIDIKPYIPYADTASGARGGFADGAPSQNLHVEFSDKAKKKLSLIEEQRAGYEKLKDLIIETLSFDPRPAYKSASDKKKYGLRLYEFDVTWTIKNDLAFVSDVRGIED